MPSFPHEAPLTVLREDPSLIPLLLREEFGVDVPEHVRIEVADADFTQALPAELRADLVVVLRGGPPDNLPVMGIVVEVQRGKDTRKRATWPLYLASLHARLGCATCLVVVASDESVASWAATPISTLHPGTVLTPIVLGPSRVPRPDVSQAQAHPWLAVLAALLHGDERRAAEIAQVAMDSLAMVSVVRAKVGYNLLKMALDRSVAKSLEVPMNEATEEFHRWILTLRAEDEADALARCKAFRLSLRDVAEQRFGPMSPALVSQIESCLDEERLRAAVVRVSVATDVEAVARVLAEL